MYTAQISARTGCRFIGTDITLAYLEEGIKTAERLGVADKVTLVVRVIMRVVIHSLHVGHFVSRRIQTRFLVGERLAAPARARKRSDVTRGHMWAT